MPDPNETPVPEAADGTDAAVNAEETNFAQLLEEFSPQAAASAPSIGERHTGTVVNISEDTVLVDVGSKAEGLLPIAEVRGPDGQLLVQAGDTIEVSIEGRDDNGNFKLLRVSPDRPRNVEDLKLAHEQRLVVTGRVIGVVKGGLAVQVGVRAFLPQSRSGIREATEMHKLIGQEIRCRVARVDAAKKSVVLDRRSVLEAEQKAAEEAALERLHEHDVVSGTVKSVATYGAFIDLGGIDALLHVSDMSWSRINDPSTLTALGDVLDVKILKIDPVKRRVSVGLKQLTPDPWELVGELFKVGDRITGTVQRTTDFGAFVELAPGVEGLIHVSEMSWSRRIRRASDVVKPGETVETVILGLNIAERRIALGLKQALGDPWADAETRFAPGSIVEGRVRNLQPFGAFVELAEGVDGMIHVGDLSDKRISNPNEVIKVGDTVRAMVLDLDREKRRIRLGVKQLLPTPLDTFIAAHQVGDIVSGRVVRAHPGRVELGESVEAVCPNTAPPVKRVEEGTLAAKLAAVWKPAGNAPAAPATPVETEHRVQLKAGEMRKFRLTKLDAEHKAIEVEPA